MFYSEVKVPFEMLVIYLAKHITSHPVRLEINRNIYRCESIKYDKEIDK
jgi:hypothetical protein